MKTKHNPDMAAALRRIIAILTQPVQYSKPDPATPHILRSDAAFAVKTAKEALAKTK